MPAATDFTPPALTQPLLRGVIRTALRGLFRSLVRPPTPIALQRGLLRLLTLSIAPHGVTRTRSTIGGRPCEWQRPQGATMGVFLYLHGGAYLIGSPATHRAITAALAKLGNLTVCALDYRLAPEHRYPAALEDAVAAYQALLAEGYRAEQIAIGGDSAGGNLALITALRLQELGLPAPSSLSDLTVRSEGKTGLRQFLRSFEANSHSIQRERAQKMTKSGFSAVEQR